ncbi:MAG: leucine-responsive regulatory protein, Lrp/AsnC family transcriptional regulator, leucine-responsive regulatory protein [archaeon GW2011_AR17]|nr:MAG: leucine-responsive regulatory protein, Lrp/AsnC family transcriptional regulator, leucine-responsive regulatory protein [archaeon GW2011_AR17]MBS3154725.1 Lrp/AsnC family transcriptional regulator [Candidatus Woesearchaeota archaeon]HIH15756.1 Lrp/AsnC family transcriptional regulator [Nanoarchaeota archaeon]HIH58432.1 Lrp/AsnC family transcriptional regulator [Nanoarchaeota archaeon]HII13718.1 Lrp/AsnC family transcriptional regulator [Nanoarchaeota archaeon]
MKEILDKIDKKLLNHLNANARMPETELAKKIGRSKESTRYRIKRLQEEKVITGFFTRINPYALGYEQYTVYLELRVNEKKNEELFNRIQKDPSIYWVGTTDGKWNLGITMLVESPRDFYEKYNRLILDLEEQIISKEIIIPIDVTIFSLSFLVKEAEYALTIEPTEIHIDEKDKIILNTLQADGRMRLIDIAKKTGFNTAFVRKKMKELEKSKVIINYGTGINLRMLRYTTYRVALGVKENSEKVFGKLKAFAKKERNIIHIIRSIAKWDYELVLVTKEYEEYIQTMSRLKESFKENITLIQTSTTRQTEIFPAKIIK